VARGHGGSRANLVIEDMIPTPNDDAFFEMMLVEAVLLTQTARLLDHPDRSVLADYARRGGALMAGPLIGGRRPISWRLAIVVSFVAAYATARWLEGIFGAGISGTVSFFVLVRLIAATWRINSRAANRQSELLGSARFGDRADVRKLEASGDLPIGRPPNRGSCSL
jgi:hypothetical protein